MRNIRRETCAKCVRKDYLSCVLFANVADFALFAGALCERRRTCVIRCTFLEFPGITPSGWSWVRIHRILRNSRELLANCAKSG